MSYSDKIKEILDKINTAKKTCIDNLNNLSKENNSKKISIINEYYTFILKIYDTYSYLTTCRISYKYRECESEKKKYYEQLVDIFNYNNLMNYTQKSTAPLVPNSIYNIDIYISNDNSNKKKFIKLIKDHTISLKEKIKTHCERSGKENCNSEQNGGKKITKKTTTKKTTTKKPKK